VQLAHDGVLALDHLAHAPELASNGVALSFVAQQLALFGVGLLELDAFCLGRFDQFEASGLQQLAAGGVGSGFFLLGGAGSDILFCLGGADTFKFDLATAGAADRDRVWDLTAADRIVQSNGNRLTGEALRAVVNSAIKVDSDADGAVDDLRLSLSQAGKLLDIDLVNTAGVWLNYTGNFLSTNPTAD
jgi:hypothetical protein